MLFAANSPLHSLWAPLETILHPLEKKNRNDSPVKILLEILKTKNPSTSYSDQGLNKRKSTVLVLMRRVASQPAKNIPTLVCIKLQKHTSCLIIVKLVGLRSSTCSLRKICNK